MTGSRRSFLGVLSAIAGTAVLRPAEARASAAYSRRPFPPTEEWDLSWLDELQGKHRQVFDLGVPELEAAANYLRAFREVYRLEHPQVNAVVGIAYKAYPINAVDALWVKYELGARWKINDYLTGKPATRNIFIEPPAGASDVMREVAVRALRSRGAIFWQCNNALNKVVEELSRDTKQPFDAVRAELIAGLVPGVKLIPAHTMLIGLAQEHGCTYEKR
ncbi:MAG TPA: hypothetical protein VGQ52_19490 [Gemmatimonadaceae bacterium]|jgi:hypothetical protein|nr:hypothetical protein [Gemmatimonadaceae bacterium]